MNSTNQSDFFYFLLKDNPITILTITSLIIQVFIVPAFLLCIIWYERVGSDNNRTLIGMMVSANCWVVIEYNIMIQFTDLIRYLTGPMSDNICFLKTVIRGSSISQLFLYYDCIALMRYLYIFCLKNPAGFQDEFWFRFATSWIKGFSFLFNGAWYYASGHQPLNYYICNGTDPTEDFKKPIKIYGVLDIATVVFNLFIFLRIRIFKHLGKKNKVEAIGHAKTFRKAFWEEVKEQSLASFSMNIIVVITLSTTKLGLNLLNSIEPKQLPENGTIILGHYVITPGILMVLYLLSFYAKHASLRRALWNKAVDLKNEHLDKLTLATGRNTDA